MHKLMDYVCDELEELERKVEKGGKLTMAETEYVGELLDAKKDMLKIGEMEEMGGSSFAMRSNRNANYEGRSYGSYNMGGSYADGRGRGSQADRDRMGRYSSERGYSRDDEFMSRYEDLPEHKKHKLMQMMKEL